jgi:hypothetical protein
VNTWICLIAGQIVATPSFDRTPVFADLRSAIESGEFPVGVKLPPEAAPHD